MNLAGVALVLALFAGAEPPASNARAKAAAGALLDEGNALFAKKNFDAALARYRAAYEIFPTPKIFFNFAEAHRALGDLVRALDYYEKFLGQSGVEKESALYKQAAKTIEELTPKVGTLAIGANVLGPEIYIDGAARGRLPFPPVRVMPGKHEVVAQLPGYESSRTTVDAAPAVTTNVHLEMKPDLVAARTAQSANGVVATTPPPPPPETNDESILGAWWLWAAVGAVALTATGIGIGVAASSGGGTFDPGGELGLSSTSSWNTR